MSKITATIDKKPKFQPFTVRVDITFESLQEIDNWKKEMKNLGVDYSEELYDTVNEVNNLLIENQ